LIFFAAGARSPQPAPRPLRSARRARRMRRPSRRTTSAPIWPRIGSMPGWQRTFAPGLGRRAAGQRRRVMEGRAAWAWCERWGKVAGSFGDAGRILAGRFGDVGAAAAPSAQAGAPGEGVEPGGGRARPEGTPPTAQTAASRWRLTHAGSLQDPSGILPGSWPDPSGTVRGRFEGDSRASGRRKRRQTTPATPARAPGGCPGRQAGPRPRWSVGPVCLHGFMANPFLGVHLNPTRQRAGPSQVHRLHQLPARWRRHRSTHETTI
jgi:hypothetical protein